MRPNQKSVLLSDLTQDERDDLIEVLESCLVDSSKLELKTDKVSSAEFIMVEPPSL